MNKISKRAILSVLSLVLTFVALGATTFAWFSLGTTATVNDFDVHVKGSEGLEISLGDTGLWYTTISSDVMHDYIKDLLNENKGDNDDIEDGKIIMDALTSQDGKTLYKLGDRDESKYLTHKEVDKATANKDYLSLTVKLRTKTERDIDLSKLNVTTSGVKEWTVDQDFTLAKDKEKYGPNSGSEEHKTYQGYLEDALRISFVHGEEDDEKITVFEKAADGTNTKGVLAKNDDDKYIGGFEYYAKKIGVADLKPASGWTVASTDGEFGDVVNTSFTLPTEVNTDGYKEVVLKINIWFEGYDNEAFNAVLGQHVSIGFEFNLKEEDVEG